MALCFLQVFFLPEMDWYLSLIMGYNGDNQGHCLILLFRLNQSHHKRRKYLNTRSHILYFSPR